MKTVNHYQRMISEYCKRRRLARYRYSGERYKVKTQNITYKISLWRQKLKRLQTGLDRVYESDKLFCLYHGYSARSIPKCSRSVAKQVFCKYCIESGIKSKFVSMYLKLCSGKRAGDIRLEFTRSFATKPENRQAYHNFLAYIQDMV